MSMEIFNYRPNLGCVRSGRLSPNEKQGKAFERIKEEGWTKYGFYWWYWVPYFSWNKGKFSMQDQCIHYGVGWLCWNITLYFWRNSPNAKYGQQPKGIFK